MKNHMLNILLRGNHVEKTKMKNHVLNIWLRGDPTCYTIAFETAEVALAARDCFSKGEHHFDSGDTYQGTWWFQPSEIIAIQYRIAPE